MRRSAAKGLKPRSYSTGRKAEGQGRAPVKRWKDREATIDQGFYYLYMIVGLQALFAFVIMGIVMFIGKVISTPGWVFLAMFAIFAASMVYIYRKAKERFRKFRESFGKADRNYEISIMGGMLTMKIEQNPKAPKLLEAPFSGSAEEPVEQAMDAKTEEDPPARKSAHLS